MSKQIHKDIRARIHSFIDGPNRFLLLKLPTGSGKTTNVLHSIDELYSFDRENWIYLAPYHTNILENLKMSPFRRYEYLHLQSRARVCIMPQWRAIADRLNIRPICENRCPLREDGCPYYEARDTLFRNPQNWAGVHSHIPTFLKDFLCESYVKTEEEKTPMGDHYGVLIIDENPINVLFLNQKGNSEQIGRLRETIINLRVDHEDYDRVIDFLNFLIISYIGDRDLDYDELWDKFNVVEWFEFYEQYQIQLLEEVVNNNMTVASAPRNYIEWFSRIQNYGNRNKIERMIVKKNESGYTAKHYYFMCYDEGVLMDLPVKIIALDATARVEIWESIIGEEASVFDKTKGYNNMYQLIDGEYPLSSWIKPHSFEIRETGYRLCTLIDLIAKEKKNDVLIICNRALKHHIQRATEADNLIFGYYYYLRSRNDFYHTADTIILACQPNIPEFQIECFSELSNWGKDIWRGVFTDEEMIQAVGRIRESIGVVPENNRVREKREIYIFPSYRHEQYPEPHIVDVFEKWAKKMTYNELRMLLEEHRTCDMRLDDLGNRMLEMIPEKGIYKTYLIREFAKENECTKNEAERIFRRMRKKELIKYRRQKKIYPGLARKSKRE